MIFIGSGRASLPVFTENSNCTFRRSLAFSRALNKTFLSTFATLARYARHSERMREP